MDNSQVAAALRDLADRLSDGPLVDGYVIAIRKQGYWYTEGGDSWDREAADGAIGAIRRHMTLLSDTQHRECPVCDETMGHKFNCSLNQPT